MRTLLLIIVLLGLSKAKAQNEIYQLTKMDTTGSRYLMAFMIANSNLGNVDKISFYKNSGSTQDLIKEITVTPVGNYFLLVDGESIYPVQNLFHATFSIDKNEYAGVSGLTYKLMANNTVIQTYNANKPD